MQMAFVLIQLSMLREQVDSPTVLNQTYLLQYKS